LEKTPIADTPLITQSDKNSIAQSKEAPATQSKTPTTQPEKIPITQPDETPIIQPDMEPDQSTSTITIPQNATQNTTLENATNTLKIALSHVVKAFQKATSNLNQGEDQSHITIETSLYIIQEIENNLNEMQQYLTQQKANPIELGKYFNHLKQTLKEIITIMIKKIITNIIKEIITTIVT